MVDTERVDPAKSDDDAAVESTELDDPPDLMTFPMLADGQMVKVALLPDSQGVVSCSSPAHQGPPRLPREDPQNHMLAHESGYMLQVRYAPVSWIPMLAWGTPTHHHSQVLDNRSNLYSCMHLDRADRRSVSNIDSLATGIFYSPSQRWPRSKDRWIDMLPFRDSMGLPMMYKEPNTPDLGER